MKPGRRASMKGGGRLGQGGAEGGRLCKGGKGCGEEVWGRVVCMF